MTKSLAEVDQSKVSNLDTCQACGSSDLRSFYEVDDVPVHSCVIFPTQEEALAYPTRGIDLTLCQECGFIQNALFSEDLVDYTQDYEETQGFSPEFRSFARRLARSLVDRYGLTGKEILEIGCGKGEFLALLCELGPNRGVGIDPAFVPERNPSKAAGRITYIKDFYGEEFTHLTGDLICCRHTLEHISGVREFLDLVTSSLRARTDSVLFLEVPDTARVLEEAAFWDIYYEHCSYFTAGSLGRLIRSSGLEVLDLRKDFGDQYLLLEARPGSGRNTFSAEEELGQLVEQVNSFEKRVLDTRQSWSERLTNARDQGNPVAIWGGGSKAVAFLTTLGFGEEVNLVVDINPHKQGKFLPGTGHEVVAPERLLSEPPGLVVVMNPVYEEEIGHSLEEMGIDAHLVSV